MTITIKDLEGKFETQEEFVQKCMEVRAKYSKTYSYSEDDVYDGTDRFGLTYDGKGVTKDFEVKKAKVPNLFKVMI